MMRGEKKIPNGILQTVKSRVREREEINEMKELKSTLKNIVCLIRY